jgi:hypothetical protein
MTVTGTKPTLIAALLGALACAGSLTVPATAGAVSPPPLHVAWMAGARPSGTPLRYDRGHRTCARNDPAGAYPRNAFFSHLIPFLSPVTSAR